MPSKSSLWLADMSANEVQRLSSMKGTHIVRGSKCEFQMLTTA